MDQEDRDRLIRIDENVKDVKEAIRDHEKRVRSLEVSRGWLWGAGGALTFLGGLAEWLFHRK